MLHQAPPQAHPLKFLSHIDPLDLQGVGVVEIRLGRGLVQLQIARQCFAAVQEVKRGIRVLQLPPQLFCLKGVVQIRGHILRRVLLREGFKISPPGEVPQDGEIFPCAWPYPKVCHTQPLPFLVLYAL